MDFQKYNIKEKKKKKKKKKKREREKKKQSHKRYFKMYRYKIDNKYQKAKIKNLKKS